MSGAKYTATVILDGVACGRYPVPVAGLKTARGLIARVKFMLQLDGIACRTLHGVGPDGCDYIQLTPTASAYRRWKILIEEGFQC